MNEPGNEPPLIIKGEPIDFELCELLGEKPWDFVVLCADSEQVPFYGTPRDSPTARRQITDFVHYINDRSKKSVWPEFFRNWKKDFISHYKLPAETTPLEFHPTFSFAISRVVCGHSKYLHAAVQLIEQLGPRVRDWQAGTRRGRAFANLQGTKASFCAAADTVALAIAQAAKRLLQSLQ